LKERKTNKIMVSLRSHEVEKLLEVASQGNRPRLGKEFINHLATRMTS
jgi:hypothetical protein